MHPCVPYAPTGRNSWHCGPDVSRVVVGDNEIELIYSIRRIPQTGFKSRNRYDFGHHDVRMLQCHDATTFASQLLVVTFPPFAGRQENKQSKTSSCGTQCTIEVIGNSTEQAPLVSASASEID